MGRISLLLAIRYALGNSSHCDIPLDSNRTLPSSDQQSIQKLFVQHAEYSLVQTKASLKTNSQCSYKALAYSIRDRLIERWKDTDLFFQQQEMKRINYLSLEFLLGRSLHNAMSNLHIQDNFTRALAELGIKIEELFDEEHDAGLGNGGKAERFQISRLVSHFTCYRSG